jgi:serine/threonine protein kinase
MDHGIVHGDIKPENFLRCKDGKLRLCDFGESAPIGDKYEYEKHTGEGWACATDHYVAPNRNYFGNFQPATISDDLYALGLSIWAVYTRQVPFEEGYLTGRETRPLWELVKSRRTVDVFEVDDVEVRSLIRGYLRQGGALV